MNKFDLLRAAVSEARATQRAVNQQAETMASLLSQNGTLRNVPPYVLTRLKRQLRNFNMTTGAWNDS